MTSIWSQRRDSFSSDHSIPRPCFSTERHQQQQHQQHQQQQQQQQQQKQQHRPPTRQDERDIHVGRPKTSCTSFTNMAYESHRDEEVDNDSVNQEIIDAGGGGAGRGGSRIAATDGRSPSRLVSYRRPSAVSGSALSVAG